MVPAATIAMEFVAIAMLIAMTVMPTIFAMMIVGIPVVPMVIVTVQVDTEQHTAHEPQRVVIVVVGLGRRHNHQGCRENGSK